jgi:exodeoxyribonuclease III
MYHITDFLLSSRSQALSHFMKIISINTNGIRAAARKGFFDWLPGQNADVICVQETKAQIDQLQDSIFHPEGYHCSYCDALKKGYSGTAIYARHKPLEVIRGFGESEFDNEGRYLEYRYQNLSVISLYAPSGSSGDHRQESKERFLVSFKQHLQALRRKRREFIICGDWNIAHKEIDLKNWRSNQKNSGFLPHERAWLSEIFDDIGYVDAFREVEPGAEQYTWWSNRGQAWDKNVGWRIDYQVVTPKLKPTVESASVFKQQRFSDHAPLIMDYRFDIDA